MKRIGNHLCLGLLCIALVQCMAMQWSSLVLGAVSTGNRTLEYSTVASEVSTAIETQQQALLQHIHDLTMGDVHPLVSGGAAGVQVPCHRNYFPTHASLLAALAALENSSRVHNALLYHCYSLCVDRLRSYQEASGYYLYALCKIII